MISSASNKFVRCKFGYSQKIRIVFWQDDFRHMIDIFGKSSAFGICLMMAAYMQNTDHMKVVISSAGYIVRATSPRVCHNSASTAWLICSLRCLLGGAITGVERVAGTELVSHLMFHCLKKVAYIGWSTTDPPCLRLIITGRTAHNTTHINTILCPGLAEIIVLIRQFHLKKFLTRAQ